MLYGKPLAAALLVLTSLVSAAPTAVAAAGTAPEHFQDTDVIWAFFDTSDPCLFKEAALEASAGRAGGGQPLGYNFEFAVADQCTGEVLLNATTPEFLLSTDQMTLSPTQTRVTVHLSGPVDDVYTGATGTFSINQTLTFPAPTGSGFRSERVICEPLQVDPETGEPVPGTQYMRTLIRYASGARQSSLKSVTGPLTVTMSDGTTYNFAPSTADRMGQIYARAGSTFQRVTGPLDTCQDSSSVA